MENLNLNFAETAGEERVSMALLKRKITESIDSWRTTKTNQGLLITGARQVGKSKLSMKWPDCG